MKKELVFLIVLFISGCNKTATDSTYQWKTIEVGDYLINFPPDFELIKDKGVDSYVGRIKGDSMYFGFDFGYYSDDFIEAPQEYLEDGCWKHIIPYQFMQAGCTYDLTNTPQINVLKISPATMEDSILGKGCDYVANCKYENIDFKYAVYIPKNIKENNFELDTVENYLRKIVLSKNSQKGTTGIYIKDLNSFNKTLNNYKALSIATSNITPRQQELALKIFESVRHK
jgi:hypothetical protein